jgi:hypothetical protein
MHDPEFQTIRDRNSQLIFLKSFAPDQCWLSVGEKKLANIYQTSVGHMKRLRSVARKRAHTDTLRIGRGPILTEDQDHQLIGIILEAATNGKCLRKGACLDEVERRYGKALTYGWMIAFLA